MSYHNATIAFLRKFYLKKQDFNADRLKMAPNQRAMKKWEIFPGRNKFFCDGFLMTAPNTSIFYLTVVLITGTSTLFFVFDCPFLAERISIGIPIIGGNLHYLQHNIFTLYVLFRHFIRFHNERFIENNVQRSRYSSTGVPG